MAQHLPIQAKHQFQLKTAHQNTQNNSVSAWPSPHAARRNCSRPPGGIHLPPGASVLPDPTGFSSPPGGAHRAARRLSVQTPPHAKAIAWRLSVARQAPYQNNPFLVYALQLIQFTLFASSHRSHNNPKLNPHIVEPTNIICTQHKYL